MLIETILNARLEAFKNTKIMSIAKKCNFQQILQKTISDLVKRNKLLIFCKSMKNRDTFYIISVKSDLCSYREIQFSRNRQKTDYSA